MDEKHRIRDILAGLSTSTGLYQRWIVRCKSLAWIVLTIPLFLAGIPAKALDCPYINARSITSTPTQKIYGKLDVRVTAGSLFESRQWAVYVANAPATEGQIDVSSGLTLADGTKGRRVGEIGGVGRSLYFAQTSDPMFLRGLSFSAEYRATLNKRSLASNPSTNHVSLAPADKEKYLQETRTYDFSQQPFKDWLVTSGLEKSPEESTIGFAWRVYDFVRSRYSYKYIPTQTRRASSLCGERETDCGGSCYLFVSALRRNGVPARAIAGRWAKTSTHLEESGSAETGTFHVRAEFFVQDIGWIPVDVSRAMGASDDKVIRSFGNDDGRFFVMHIDPDFVLQSVFFGEKHVRMLQRCAYWTKGSGKMNRKMDILWTVIKEK